MLIVMHQSHSTLPFWDAPKQPRDLFDPKRHGNMKVVVAGEKLLARNTRLWPVLVGLHAVNLPVMAHVAAFCKEKDGTAYQYCKPLWLQITTLPQEFNRRGIPRVIQKRKLAVRHVWIGNDERGSFYQFLNRDALLPGADGHSATCWTDFFIERLSWLVPKPQPKEAAEAPEVPKEAVAVPA